MPGRCILLWSWPGALAANVKGLLHTFEAAYMYYEKGYSFRRVDDQVELLLLLNAAPGKVSVRGSEASIAWQIL